MPISRWIYVTAVPRSGITFVGKVLSHNISVNYIHEPFNPDCGLPSIDKEFLYVAPKDDDWQ